MRAAANTRLVGKQLAFLLKGLKKNNNLDFERVHIIGFRFDLNKNKLIYRGSYSKMTSTVDETTLFVFITVFKNLNLNNFPFRIILKERHCRMIPF